MALVRPLSGTGAMGVMTEIMAAKGPDSLIGYMVSTMSGCTDTTFFILAVYFGAMGVKRTRHALLACLLADLAGVLAAVSRHGAGPFAAGAREITPTGSSRRGSVAEA